jgi:hypothetical protein
LSQRSGPAALPTMATSRILFGIDALAGAVAIIFFA